MQSIDGITIKEYARAIANIIGHKAIKFFSNGRICMYLDSKKTVRSLTSKYKTVVVNNTNIEIRPMVLPAQRIILSNIAPIILNSAIENMFKRNNIKLYSKITPLKTGITDPDLAHILSFRRQVYVDPEHVKRTPSSFPITLENNTFRIFATIEKQTCFNCNQEGHTANHCPNNADSNVSIFQINPNPNSTPSSHTDDLPKEVYGHNGGCDVREVPIVLSFGFLLPSERDFE